MRMLSILLLVSAGFMGLAACSDEPSNGAGGNGGSAGSAGMGGMGGTGGGMGGGMGGTGGGAAMGGYCGKSCAMPADCCPMGVPNCPGNYPNNWTCDDGVCGPPQCTGDADCTFGGAAPDFKCFTINDYKTCAEGCAADADCPMNTKCIGEDDNGAKYCSAEPMMTGGCMADADCNGYGKCNTASGVCECAADADCTGAGVDTCVL
ncbi:hypothetical protein [Polyangium jinanense]|uniref:PE-PGRS family protein n=1 Tax=Polyangium jinanense TaxID=2829994 RepID=A0A9X4APG1_9BACT|nr:hypothetical protein [Polyangium jinanense]MDC3952344.1 hypothetical protein [Polyangium jinanense]MDC3979973.1 hypothetical protein [Polyangium jinanense]